MIFQLPNHLEVEALRELVHAHLVGGGDNMPWPTRVRVEDGQLLVQRQSEDSGYFCVPWEVSGLGRFMLSTATLIERPSPYHLLIELARGKTNQVRTQAAEWQLGGLQVSPELTEKLRQVGLSFARAVTQQDDPRRADVLAEQTILQALTLSDELVRTYTQQVFEVRHQRQPRLPTTLGCRVGPDVPAPEQTRLLREAFTSVTIPFVWSRIEPQPEEYQWERYDALVQWAREQNLAITGGPLIDFTRHDLPDWLWKWERDSTRLAGLFCDYVEAVVKRYRATIRTWHLTSASNWASLLSLEEDEMQTLTLRLLETARQVDGDLDLVLGIAQPWGEYLTEEERTYSPFVFADTLLRSGIPISAFNLELLMGVSPRGSLARDALETSRLLDLYAALGLPLRVSLGCPAANANHQADSRFQVRPRGRQLHWTPETQTDWTAMFAALALCKPYVIAVEWVHWSDGEPHLFPSCGLLDSRQAPRPALQRLKDLRETHLK
jgi:hypothetical protein